jgi:CRISPR-associated protein Cas5d
MKNSVEFKVSGRMALFTDPLSRVGGEKCSYHTPTYEAVKGILKSVYWKPTIIWVIDKVRIMKPIQTQSRNVKPLNYGGGNTLAIYTYLADVEYQVQAHFEWNEFREDMKEDRVDGKHFAIARRMIDKGGRQDIFLGARECQGYVEPCSFGEGAGAYDDIPALSYGVMFHGFDYPDETGVNELHSRFWNPVVKNGVIDFVRPEECTVRKFVREMIPHPPKSVGLLEEAIQDELD